MIGFFVQSNNIDECDDHISHKHELTVNRKPYEYYFVQLHPPYRISDIVDSESMVPPYDVIETRKRLGAVLLD